jgi:CRP-like cAMP-binding protein
MIYLETISSRVYKRREMLPHRDNLLWKIESGVVRSLTWTEDGQVICSGLWAEGDVIGANGGFGKNRTLSLKPSL